MWKLEYSLKQQCHWWWKPFWRGKTNVWFPYYFSYCLLLWHTKFFSLRNHLESERMGRGCKINNKFLIIVTVKNKYYIHFNDIWRKLNVCSKQLCTQLKIRTVFLKEKKKERKHHCGSFFISKISISVSYPKFKASFSIPDIALYKYVISSSSETL